LGQQPQGRLITPTARGVHRPDQPGDHARPALVALVLRGLVRRRPAPGRQGLHRATETPGLSRGQSILEMRFTPGLKAGALSQDQWEALRAAWRAASSIGTGFTGSPLVVVSWGCGPPH